MIYSSVLSAVVSALAAECIDNTAKQAWQRLYAAGEGKPCGPAVSAEDRMDADCWVFARLHSQLRPEHWSALVAKYSAHARRKAAAIGFLVAYVESPAPVLFRDRCITAWAIPKLKGVDGKRSSGVITLPAGWYDMNNWDPDARPEQTRRRWRGAIRKAMESLVDDALVEAQELLSAEGVLIDKAA